MIAFGQFIHVTTLAFKIATRKEREGSYVMYNIQRSLK